MKKLLSICFLSILLSALSFGAYAQSSSSECCFWLENLKPQTLHNIANVPGGVAALPGTGGDVVLNNTMNQVLAGYYDGQYHQTDFYKIRFSNNCELPENTKVSLEWKLYRDGQLVNGNISDYADFRIYTRYERLNNLTDDTLAGVASCGHMRWMGGPVNNFAICQEYQNYCVGGYPGAMQAEHEFPYATNSYDAAGLINNYEPYAASTYQNIGLADGYALDYFNLPFFEATDHVIAIRWKQVGNYSLVVGLRERTGGTAYPSLYWTNDEGMQNTELGAIGGHQSCCGRLLASDSIHYLVTTHSMKAVCDGDTYDYGQPVATFSQEGRYLVIFGQEDCGHFVVDHLDTLDFFTRINPDIVAHDTVVCHNVTVTADQFRALAPAVNTNAPGLIDYKIYWSSNGVDWSENIPNFSTATPGIYTYYVKQINHYDAVTDDDFTCEGKSATFTFEVRGLLDPIVEQPTYEFCNEVLTQNSPLTLTANLDNDDICATTIHWYRDNQLVHTGLTYQVDLNELNPTNINSQVVYTLRSASDVAESPLATAPTITINFWQTPIITANATQTEYVVCPNSPVTLESAFTSTTPAGTTLSYAWTKNGSPMTTTAANIDVFSIDACTGTDTYVVTVTATSVHGCTATDTRTFTVTSKDEQPIVLTPNSSTHSDFTISGCDTNTTNLPAPLTLAQLRSLVSISDNCGNVNAIHYTPEIVSQTACQTVLNRHYTVSDVCGNTSNVYTQTYTIVNDYIPTVTGTAVSVDPIPVMECKFDAPAYAALRAAFDANFNVNFQCNTASYDVTFYWAGTTVVVDANHDIFADNDHRVVSAVVTDPCGNKSVAHNVFTFDRPAYMDITAGAISAMPSEICLHDTVFLNFDYTHVINATSPLTFEWKARPNDGSIIHHTSPIAQGVPATANTDYYYRIVVTDAYGCQDSVEAAPVHVYGNPSVAIYPDIRNGAEFPLCPTYGNLTVYAEAESGVPGEVITGPYHWSGESVNFASIIDNTFVTIVPDSCNHTYTVNLEIENAHGCIATTQYSFDVIDATAPFFVAESLISDSLVEVHENCVMYVPNFIPLFTNDNVKDNCYTLGQMTLTQNPAAGTVIHGNTQVSIVATDGCGNASVPYIITARSANPIAVEITTNNDEFCQGEVAQLTANVTNAVTPVTFVWSNSVTTMTNTVKPTETAHSYAVTVTDAMGCTAFDEIDITVYHVPVAADVTLAMTPNTYCDNAEGIADGTISVASFNHADVDAYKLSTETEWHAVDYVYSGLYQGSYTFDLRTIHGCVGNAVASINVLRDTNVVIPTTTTTSNAWCVEPFDGSITVTNPQVGYTYEIINLPNSSRLYTDGELVYENLEYGHYSIHVTTDKFCSYVKEDIIVDSTRVYPTFAYTATPQSNCETPNGEIHVTNPVAGYTYICNGTVVTANGNPISFGGLNYGLYHVAVVTDLGCRKDFYAITVPSTTVNPERPVATVTDNSVCSEEIDVNGKITILAANTVAGYTYELNGESFVADGTTDIVFEQLGHNGSDVSYNMTVTSDLGCSSVFAYTVDYDPFVVTIAANEVVAVNQTNCDELAPNGAININTVDGYVYHVYPVVGGVIGSELSSLTGLHAADYVVVKVHVETGCSVSKNITLQHVIPTYAFNTAVVDDSDCSTETGNGTITVTPATGYTFYLNGSDVPNTTGVFENLNGVATYSILAVNNETRCQYEKNVTVKTNFVYPVVNAVATSANYYCNEHKNGTVTLTSTVDDVTYYLGTETSTTGYFTGVNSGSYTYYAISSLNCESEHNLATVVDSAFIVCINTTQVPNTMCVPTFEHPGNGRIIVDCPRGAEYDYLFYDAAGNPIAVGYFDPLSYTMYNLPSGDYHVVVVDHVRGCERSTDVTVPTGYDEVTINAEVVANINCVAPYTGSITATATSTNVDAVYRYRLNGVGEFTANSVFTALASGTYTLEVKDTTTGCVYTKTNIVVPNNNIYAPIVTISENSVFCLGSEAVLHASATSTLEGDNAFTYVWNSECYGHVEGQDMPLNTNHPGACDYTVTVTSVLTGCESVVTKHVLVKENPSVNFLVDGNPFLAAEYQACANTFPHNIGVETTGLVAYNWSNHATTSNFDVNLPAGNFCIFTVTVTDNYGCQNVDSIGVRALPLFDTVVDYILCDADHTPFMGNVYTYDAVDNSHNFDTIVRVYTSLRNGCDSTVTYRIKLATSPVIAAAMDMSIYRCAGEQLATSVASSVNINWRNGDPTTYGWQRNVGGTWSAFNPTQVLTYAMNGWQVRAYATNCCGTAYSPVYTLNVDATPLVANLTVINNAQYCVGQSITENISVPTVDCRSHASCTSGWQIAPSATGTFVALSGALTAAQDGYYVRYFATNDCGTSYSDVVRIVVDQPVTPSISNITRCAGENIELTDADLHFTFTPAQTSTAPVTTTMKLGGVAYTGANLTLANNGATLEVTTTNRCGANSTTAVVTVNDKPVLAGGEVVGTCVGDITFTAPTVNWNGSVGTTKLQYKAVGSTTWSDIQVSDIDLSYNNGTLRYVATNNCGTTTKEFVGIHVYDTPALTHDATPYLVCENATLTIADPVVNWNNNAGTITYQMRTSATAPWATWTNGSTVASTAFLQIRVVAENTCGVVYDVIDVTVEDLPTLATTDPLTQTICNGSDITPIVFASNKDITLTPVASAPNSIALSGNTVSGEINYAMGNVNTMSVFTYTVSTVEGHCGVQSETIQISVKDKPSITNFSTLFATNCVGDLTYFVSTTYNHGEAATPKVYRKRVGESSWTLIANVLPHYVSLSLTADDDNAQFAYVSTNSCGSDTAYVTVHVASPVTFSAIAAVDTCKGMPLSAFVTAPTLTYNDHANVTAQGWKLDGVAVTEDTPVNADATITYYATTQCGTYTSAPVNVTVHDAPEISEVTPGTLEICDGGQFFAPTYTVNNHGATQLSATWTITKDGATDVETLDFANNYDVTYNNATITLTVENTCGNATKEYKAIVHSLPVPEMLQDTIICHNGTTTLRVVEPEATSIYKWFNGDNTEVGTGVNYVVDASTLATADATYTYYVQETDANGCVSTTAVNASYQPIATNVVTIKVTDKPRFVFKQNGVATHFIDGVLTAADGGTNTNYSWQVFNPCYNEDTLVYVTFDIYHNGQLIEDGHIGEYITTGNISAHQVWHHSDSISWRHTSGSTMNHTTLYAFAQSGVSNQLANHYPNSNMGLGLGAGNVFDDFYLHFLGDRPVYKEILPFIKSGEYKIVYKLWETSNVTDRENMYNNGSENKKIGGWNSMVSSAIRDVLVTDSIIITVTGTDGTSATEPFLAPQTQANVAEPSLRVYPNPAVDEVNAEVRGISGNTTVQIVNLSGKVVTEEAINIPVVGTYKYTTSVNGLTPGVYFITFKSESGIASKKVVVTK